ncbi:MAG TPA: VWA domain-containing protein [Chloroflexi bacterium]|nr:VWA domain-containing protein [Chloroflexota bacterium]
MSNTLSLNYTFNTPAIPVTDGPRLVYLLLEIGEETRSASLPVNLALVLDVSESMHIRVANDEQFQELAHSGLLQEILIDGVPAWQSTEIPPEVLARLPRKIDRVRDALQTTVEHLRPSDRFSLLAFAGEAVTLIKNSAGAHKERLLNVVDELDKLQLGDDTYIGRGLALGIEELRTGASANLANRLLVLTDGFTLDEDVCRTWALHARQANIPISTIGLGGEFNEELMIPIADQTGGEAYLLETPEDIPAVLAQELQRAQAVSYRHLEIKLRPAQGVQVRAAHRVRPSIGPVEVLEEGGSYNFLLGDMVAGEKPALLIEMIAPPRPAGIFRLAQALLACDDPVSIDRSNLSGYKIREDVVIEYVDEVNYVHQPIPGVMHIVEALIAYKLQRRAQADVEAGDVEGATQKLRAAATRLLDMGEEELAGEAQKQAELLERGGQTDAWRTKKLRYETRKLTHRMSE